MYSTRVIPHVMQTAHALPTPRVCAVVTLFSSLLAPGTKQVLFIVHVEPYTVDCGTFRTRATVRRAVVIQP
jgi:hypothetical protein